MVSAYWTAGGTALLSTVGGELDDLARRGGSTAVLVGVVTVALKVAGCVFRLALVRPWGARLPARLPEGVATAAGALLVLYGGALTVVGALALAGLFGPPADPVALRRHVLVWDLWFLVWGALLVTAAARGRWLRRCSAMPRH